MPITTDPLSLLFIGCFLFGLLFLVISALMGTVGHGHSMHVHTSAPAHVGHVHVLKGIHVGHSAAHTHGRGTHVAGNSSSSGPLLFFSYVNPTSIVLFLLGFGFFGYIFHTVTSFMPIVAITLAAGGGCLVAVLLLTMIARVFGDSEGATVQDVSDRIGLLGTVSLTIKGNEPGEILYVSPGGMRKSIPARSVDGHHFERGQEVVVVNYQRGIAEVDSWEHFVNEREEDTLSTQSNKYIEAPNADEQAALRALLEEPEQKQHSQTNTQKDA